MDSDSSDISLKHEEKDEADRLNKPESSEHGASDDTLSEERDGAIWSGDQSTKTARYNYATEKSLSHVDAKLFYQRHKLETSQHDSEPISPVARHGTASIEELGALSRRNSAASRTSCSTSRRREHNTLSILPSGAIGLDELVINPSIQSSDLDEIGPSEPKTSQMVRQDEPKYSKASANNSSSGFEGEAQRLALDSSYIAPELRAICTSIKNVLDIRRKYVGLSLQRPYDNPKDNGDWRIYPPPPQPVWDDVHNRPNNLNSGTNSLANSKVLELGTSTACTGFNDGSSVPEVPYSPVKQPRKPGLHIGEDFEFSELLPLPEEAESIFRLDSNSVYQVYETPKSMELGIPMVKVPTLRDFYRDLEYVKDVSSDGPSKSFAYRELDILEGKFNLYFLVNEYEETANCKRVPHRDFYNVRKVDTHVHHSACMNQKHLLRFIKSKMKKSPDEVVLFRDGKHLTLREVFESINLTAYDLSIDTLDMHVRFAFLSLTLLP
jgi:AMP deaminase